MISDLPEGATLPQDVPNANKQSLGFIAKLFGAWVAMGHHGSPWVSEIRKRLMQENHRSVQVGSRFYVS